MNITLTEAKNIIRPTLYWEKKRLSCKLFLLKQELIEEFKQNKIMKYLLEKI